MSTTGSDGRHWFKSSFSRDATSCVSVSLRRAQLPRNADTVLVRDDKYTGDPTNEPIITVPADVWSDFLAIVANEAVTKAEADAVPAIIRETDGTTTLRDSSGLTLNFTPAEWVAFTRGVQAGEFTPVPA